MNTIYMEKNDIIEIAVIGGIITENLFEKIQKELNKGLTDSHYVIGNIAYDYYIKFKDFDYESLWENTENDTFPKECTCFDECVMWFAWQEVKKLSK